MISSSAQGVSDLKLTRTIRLSSVTDPSDHCGVELPQFSLYQIYSVERSRIDVIQSKLYKKVLRSITNDGLGDSKAALIKYSAGFGTRLDERIYIVASRETNRKTQAKIFIRFHGFGDHLYVGIDSYVLGKVNWVPVFWRLAISAIVFGFGMIPIIALLPLASMGSSYSDTLISYLIVLLLGFGAFSFICWFPVIERWLADSNKSLNFALRQAFPGALNIGSFNIDDVMMFLKSTLSISVMAVRDVLKEEGLPVETLDSYVQNVTVSNVFQSSVGVVAGNVQGDLISKSSK